MMTLQCNDCMLKSLKFFFYKKSNKLKHFSMLFQYSNCKLKAIHIFLYYKTLFISIMW